MSLDRAPGSSTFPYIALPIVIWRAAGGEHLIVRRKRVDIDFGNAIAISYTWGESSRERGEIGHFEDKNIVAMTLGAEWVLEGGSSDLVYTLSDMCLEHRFCWINQLSINQDSEEGAATALAMILEIYRCFEVVALLPGARCERVIEQYSKSSNPVENANIAVTTQNDTLKNTLG